jgi:hypothetical protein
MSITIAWPGFHLGPVSLALENDVQISTARNGRVLSYGLPGSRWLMTVNFEPEMESMQRPAIEAYLVSLRGGVNRARLHHFARPRPNGTLRGSPTLSASISAGATSLPLGNCNGDLRRGDMIGIGDELFMVTADVAPVGNAMTAQIYPAARNSAIAGTAVVWDRPSALFIPRSSVAGPFPYLQGNVRPAFSVEFVEAW